MLPQTPVFFMNANAPPHPRNQTKTKQKTWIKQKQRKYSSTQYINIMLNSFQLKLVKFTKNEQNKNNCKHTVSLLKQDRRNNNKKILDKNCKHTMSR